MQLLLNRRTGLEEAAVISCPMEQEDIDCFTTEWKPIFDAKTAELHRSNQLTREGLAAHNLEDAHWVWPEKAIDRARLLEWKSLAVRCGGKTQGLMFLNMVQRCRIPSQKGEHLVYVDLLATAPWNRHGLDPHPLYRGVGQLLIAEAILLSRDEEYGGRIGLHSLPSAEQVYRDVWGMQSLGPDPDYSGLCYFEFTSEQATAFLSE